MKTSFLIAILAAQLGFTLHAAPPASEAREPQIAGQKQCTRCNGRGTFTCDNCNGTGKKDKSNCPTCKGRGKYDCTTCNGTGKVN